MSQLSVEQLAVKSMDAETGKTESERRIKAAVRAVLSSGVWLAIGLQVFVLALLIYTAIGSLLASEVLETGPGTFTVLFLVYLVVYAYVMSGTSRAFAVGTATVSAWETLSRGKEVFSQFLWLFIKVFLLVLLILYLLGIAVQIIAAATHAEVGVVFTKIAPGLLGIIAIVPFALVYWLPIVFVRNDFRLFSTLLSALQIIWRRLAKSGFLAFLVLFPVAVVWLLPSNTPFAVALAVSVCGQLMAWTAYIYCVEFVIENPH